MARQPSAICIKLSDTDRAALPADFDFAMLVLVLQVDLTRLPRRDDAMETLLGEVMARAAGDVLQYNVPKTMDACEVVAELMKTHGTPYFICIDEVQVKLLLMHSCSNAKFGPLSFVILSQDTVS